MSNNKTPQTDPDLGVWTPAVIKYNLENLSDEEFNKLYKVDKEQVKKKTAKKTAKKAAKKVAKEVTSE